jgi:hypothetical protein
MGALIKADLVVASVVARLGSGDSVQEEKSHCLISLTQ